LLVTPCEVEGLLEAKKDVAFTRLAARQVRAKKNLIPNEIRFKKCNTYTIFFGLYD
jgi:hypothetical protein